MKTPRDIEAEACKGLARFAGEYLGREPKSIRAHLVNELLVVRLGGMLGVAERQLLHTPQDDTGRALLKQMRTELVESARPILAALVEKITDCTVISLHHDISTVTGEEVIIFTLSTAPIRASRK